MSAKFDKIDLKAIATLRALVIDEVNKANSGHPGMALDAAPFMYLLYRNHLISDPKNPNWFNRDRFVLSSGHISDALYVILHMAGYGVSMDDIKSFRQWGSKTPGHPEVGVTPGVDVSGGPLGMGVGQAIGIAMAEKHIAASYKEGERLCHHKVYCLCGDGCLEEGISQEAISLAGIQKLNNLILAYDANGSTLDGPTSNSMNDDVALRFKASNWDVYEVEDGNDLEALDEALNKAKESKEKPSVIIIHSVIGYGTKLAGNHKSHGSPLGEEIGGEAKAFYGYDSEPFTIEPEVYERLKETFGLRGKKAYEAYQEELVRYSKEYPEEYAKFEEALNPNMDELLKDFYPKAPKTDASRNSSGRIVETLGNYVPFTFGGSADVAGSVKTAIPGDQSFSPEHREARNMNFGIREFGMACIQNGMLLHGGVRTYIGSFLVFSDYMKSAIRMSALEEVPAIYLFSHDSIAVGEDGPTHEPIEQIQALRDIPNSVVFRPADEIETYAAWKSALLSKNHPTSIILSRQNLPLLANASIEKALKGAYILDANEKATYQLIASGSEVSLAQGVRDILAKEGIELEIVSMPSINLFLKEEKDYQESVLRLPKANRIALEMGVPTGWYRFADNVYGIERFGASAPMKDLIKHYGFEPETVADYVRNIIKKG